MASVAPRSTTLGLKGTKGQPHKLRSFACVKPSVSRTVVSAQQQDGSAETSTSGRSEATVASSRKMPYGAILALSSLGLGETVYLTAAKITNGTVACPLSEGCADILTSSYASFMGVVPLASLGVLAYGGVAALAAHGLFFAEKDSEAADRRFRTTLLTGGAVLASCSGYLMYLLLTKFSGEWCPWCIASALLSFSIAGLAASGMRERELQDAAGPELGLVASTLLVLSLGLGNPGVSDAEDMVLPYREPEITSDSTKRTMQLSRRLPVCGVGGVPHLGDWGEEAGGTAESGAAGGGAEQGGGGRGGAGHAVNAASHQDAQRSVASGWEDGCCRIGRTAAQHARFTEEPGGRRPWPGRTSPGGGGLGGQGMLLFTPV